MFHAARSGKLADLQLQPEDFNYRVGCGDSIAHVAARWGYLDLIPPELLTEAVLSRKNDRGQNPRELAARFLELPRLQRLPLLQKHACSGGIGALQPTGPELDHNFGNGNRLLHTVARWGHLKEIAAELLTPERLARRNSVGATPEWLARQAENPHFITANRLNNRVHKNHLEPAALTLEVLTLPLTPNGWTLAHTLAYFGQLSQLPRAFQTLAVLGQKAGDDRTVYQIAPRGSLRLPSALLLQLDEDYAAQVRGPRSLAEIFGLPPEPPAAEDSAN